MEDLYKMTAKELREEAKKLGVEGVHAMKKDELVKVITSIRGGDKRQLDGAILNLKSSLKKRIRELKVERDKAISEKDRERLKKIRNEIKKLKRRLRRIVERAAR